MNFLFVELMCLLIYSIFDDSFLSTGKKSIKPALQNSWIYLITNQDPNFYDGKHNVLLIQIMFLEINLLNW